MTPHPPERCLLEADFLGRSGVVPFRHQHLQQLLPNHNLHTPGEWHQATTELFDRVLRPTPTRWQELLPRLFPTPGMPCAHDLVGISHGLMQRLEEAHNPERDPHGRFPASASLLTKHGVLRLPLVDWMARCVVEKLRETTALTLQTPQHRGALTFDVDSSGFWQASGLGGRLKRSVLQQKANPTELPGSLWRTFRDFRRDPDRPFTWIAEQLAQRNTRCTVFVQAQKAHQMDDYHLPRCPALIRQLRSFHHCGHELGLHSSYAAPGRPPKFWSAQQQTLKRIFGLEQMPHRSHYIRHGDLIDDVERWKSFSLDSSLGYSWEPGFRLGTAWPVMLPGGVLEIAPHAMDVTLRHHQRYTPSEARRALQGLYAAMEQTGGVFTILWHPHNLNALTWGPWRDVPFFLMDEQPQTPWETLTALRQWFLQQWTPDAR